MSSKTRVLGAGTPAPKGPTDPIGWNRLLQVVIARAISIGSPAVPGLQAALMQGKSETHLRRLGILSQTDIDREFPPPK